MRCGVALNLVAALLVTQGGADWSPWVAVQGTSCASVRYRTWDRRPNGEGRFQYWVQLDNRCRERIEVRVRFERQAVRDGLTMICRAGMVCKDWTFGSEYRSAALVRVVR